MKIIEGVSETVYIVALNVIEDQLYRVGQKQ